MKGILSVSLFTFIELVILVDFGAGPHLACLAESDDSYISALGDPGMRDPYARFGLEAWNSCNEVGEEAPNMGSPRMADCTDFYCPDDSISTSSCDVRQKVNETDNRLKAGDKFPSGHFNPSADVDNYAVQKELYLGSLCEQRTVYNETWQFWMIMLKNGNLDKTATFCPENGKKVNQTVTNIHFPCFGTGCMNQPLVYHNESKVVYDSYWNTSLTGGFYGTYDLDSNVSNDKKSLFQVTWRKNPVTYSWNVSFTLTTSAKYPWLMLYLRSDATKGFNGGYHYDGRGMMRTLPESPYFKVKLTLDIKKGGGGSSQFYLTDIGGCWKNNGDPCDGDVTTDVTRYSEMIINPSTGSTCGPSNLQACPPQHISTTGEIIHRTNKTDYPYSAYHYYCAPGNADDSYLEKPSGTCDPYSNPQAQELVQILPHPEWAVHGYPAAHGVGWENGPRTWDLDTGALSSRLYFYQDPGTPPAKRVWRSINCGTEMYFGAPGKTAQWSVSDFDVLVPKPYHRIPEI
ncbi:hypothetical protein PHJA_002203600 [Phtheirospermum japonicum]|uniref:DUF7705 domain-containing protein n=1 Tax=Phtheirospermum japonicum TaxID=374723 RepID=A0A830CMN4_9LAMI|nr:hypothetical protein PHJA_002203600 [Phtheirospermum japonicum]